MYNNLFNVLIETKIYIIINLFSSRSTGAWATLTSTNAWASRSQPRPAPAEPKIDYFDNPPEN